RLVFGQYDSTCLAQGVGAGSTIRAHAGQDGGDSARTEVMSHREQRDVDRWADAVHLGVLVELDAAAGRDTYVEVTWGHQRRARAQLIASHRLTDGECRDRVQPLG